MFICPECRSVYHEQIKRCERDQEPLVPVQANQNVRTYPLLNQELDGRYHLIGGLGQGGVGTVYLANHIHLDQLSAVKFLDIDQLGQADEEQREETLSDFVKEAKLAMLLRHDSVVRVMDYGVFEGSPFLVMEYIPGPSLLRQINTGQSFSIEQCLNIIRKLADALNAFHERKLVHRDLKPANVIVDPRENGQLTLVDLGLVKDLSTEARSSTHPLALRGTPGYLSPEQVPSWVLSSAGVEVTSDKKQIDSRVDIYALGVLAYEIITGRTPYPKGLSATKVIIHACTQEPPPIEQLRPELRDYPGLAQLVKSMMSRSPEGRPLDGREVMQRIDEIIEDGHDPVALRDELARAQSALAQRMATASGGHMVPPPVASPTPTPPGGSLVNRPSVSGALIAPPPSMTGSFQAIQVDDLVSSPQLSNPSPIESIERSLQRQQEELAGLETQSEGSLDPLNSYEQTALAASSHDFNEHVVTTLKEPSAAEQTFMVNELTIAGQLDSRSPRSGKTSLAPLVGLLALMVGGITWALSASSSPEPAPVTRLSTRAQPDSALTLALPRPRAPMMPSREPYQPQPLPKPSQSPIVLSGASRIASSGPQSAEVRSPQAQSEPTVKAAQEPQVAPKVTPKPKPKPKRAAKKSRRSSRRAQRTRSRKASAHKQRQSNKAPKKFRPLTKGQFKALLTTVAGYRDEGDIDRARAVLSKQMSRIDPDSSQYHDLHILWNDLNK